MSKITFRADSDLVDAVEALDASKSEVMRDALRTYLEQTVDMSTSPLDEVVREHGDAVVDHQLGESRTSSRDVNIRVLVESASDLQVSEEGESERQRASSERQQASPGDAHEQSRGHQSRGHGGREQSCAQCGKSLSADHVYCPNCGEKATNRVFCECGDEVRADWAFCPHCGRRTASAEAFDR